MSAPTNAQLYESALTAILAIQNGQAQEKMFNGRKYTVLDLPALNQQAELYRRMGIQDGSIAATSATSVVNVSTVYIVDPFLYQ